MKLTAACGARSLSAGVRRRRRGTALSQRLGIMARKSARHRLLFVLGLILYLWPRPGHGQAVAPMRASVLYRASDGAAPSLAIAPDTVRDKKVAAAIGFGLLSGLAMAVAIGDADGDTGVQTRLILLFAAVGAIAGYVTGGRSSSD